MSAFKDYWGKDAIATISPWISAFVPSVFLVSVTALMPALVGRSELLVRHWTRSGLNRAVMRKTLFLLLLMVLILPSLGLSSAAALLDWVVNPNNTSDTQTRWECVFLPDQVQIYAIFLKNIFFILNL